MPRVSNGQSRLNFDVLHLICNCLIEVSDVLSFSLTCSTLRKGALQRRLGMSPVVLSHPESVERFHKFIFADPASRALYLYGLVLSPDTDYSTPNGDPHFINCLVAIMEVATHLEYLYFPTNTGRLACAAVTKLTRLRELVVVSDNRSQSPYAHQEPEAFKRLLTALRSPLQYLTISDYQTGRISTSFLHDNLRHLTPTLRNLVLEDLFFDIPPSSVTTTFVAMRSLTISSSMYQTHLFQMDALLRLFPNLDDTLFLKGFGASTDKYPTLRGKNKEAQREFTWSGLDHVIYSAELAYLMALRCPIRRMDIDGLMLNEMPYLAEALRDSCPRHLLLPISCFNHGHLQNLDVLFPPEAANKLTHLVLSIKFGVIPRCAPAGGCGCISWDQSVDSLVDSVKYLRLTHLRAVFQYHVYAPASGSDSQSMQTAVACSCGEDFTRNVAQEVDLHSAAIRLLDTVRTLQYVSLTTCGICQYVEPWKHWHSSKAWLVAMSDEGEAVPGHSWDAKPRSCMEISDDEAEAIVDEEELYLEESGERMVRRCFEWASK